MDWIDPRYASLAETTATKRRDRTRAKKGTKRKSSRASMGKAKPLRTQVTAALSQPLEVWSQAFDHALSQLKWPAGCTAESTLLWSAIIQEQAEVLVRTGMSAKKLSTILAEEVPATPEDRAEQLSEVVGLMDQSLETIAFQWLDSADTYAHSALAVAALAWHIPDHARRAGNTWITQWVQAMMERLVSYKPDSEEAVICHLVIQCELPLLIGLATSASKRTALKEASKAMDHLAEHLESSEDNAAPWLAHGATYLRAALASVLRCCILANALGLRRLYPPQQKALAGLLKHAARWCRPDGTQLLAAGRNAPKSKAIWQALAQQAKQTKSLAACMTLSGVGQGERSKVRKNVNAASLPALTHYSTAASGVCMQSDWRQKGSRIALDFSDTEICIEALGPKGGPVLAGEWTVKVELSGQSQLRMDEWQELCWFSDDDVDYIELEAQFGRHAKVQRQLVLFRQARLLLLADTLLGERNGDWSIRANLPLAANNKFEIAKKSTEGFIETANGGRCLALPLHLPEWRRQQALADDGAGFKTDGEDLVVSAVSKTDRIFMPTLISLCNSHAKQPFTWRHLTVGDELRIVEPNEAKAFRIQIGPEQWVVYRSLGPALRRTALGMHTMADFYAGSFDMDDGEVDTLVEVEAPAG